MILDVRCNTFLATTQNYAIKSTSPYHQLGPIGRQQTITPTPKSASPVPRVNGHIQQQPVKVILSNSNGTPNPGSSYKSTIESKVKLLSQNHPAPNQDPQIYVSNMHVRVPSQESSIYGDSRTYINLGQPVAMASKAGIVLKPSNSQLKKSSFF